MTEFGFIKKHRYPDVPLHVVEFAWKKGRNVELIPKSKENRAQVNRPWYTIHLYIIGTPVTDPRNRLTESDPVHLDGVFDQVKTMLQDEPDVDINKDGRAGQYKKPMRM